MKPIDYALRYAELGWNVLPLYEITQDGVCACGNPVCHSPGKHPRVKNGLIDATTDHAILKMWFDRWPQANIGVRTGPESGILAIDIDGERGEQSIEGRFLPPCFEQLTGGGGRHLVYAHNGGRLKSGTGILPAVDSRADGGYIVVEPSNHISGNTYEWRTAPWGEIPMAAPDWWRELITPSHEDAPKARVAAIPQEGDKVATGGRNNYLTSRAGTMRRQGFEFDEMLPAMLALNKNKCNPPLDHDEVETICRSICGYAVLTPEQEEMASRGEEAYQNLMRSWNQKRQDALKHRKSDIKRTPPPERFIPDHGLARRIYDWIMAGSRYQLPYLAMAATVSFLSVLIGQKWVGHTGLKPNVYMVGMAPSGGGKDFARGRIDMLAHRCGLDNLIGGARIASGAALVSAIEENPVHLYQLDEFGLMLQLMTDKNASGHKKELMDLMMQIYTCDGVFRGTDYADRKLKKRTPIENPIVSIYGTTTPTEFYRSLSTSCGDNGFLGRMIYIDGGEDVKDASRFPVPPPIELMAAVKDFYEKTEGNMENQGHAQARAMKCPPDINAAWNKLEDDLRKSGDEITQPIYRRAHANIMKLAMIFSLSEGSADITVDSYTIARDIVLWSLDTIIDGMHQHVADSDTERDSKKIEKVIRDGGKNGVSTTELFRKTRSIKKMDRENIMNDLGAAGIIWQETIKHDGAGRPTIRWVHVDYLSDNA